MKTRISVLLTVSACIVGYFVLTARAEERQIEDRARERVEEILREAKDRGVEVSPEKARELMERLSGLGRILRQLEVNNERLAREAAPPLRENERLLHKLLAEIIEERERHEERDGRHDQIGHIREAAEHLHAAGMHEQAEDLMHEAEERERELEREHEGDHDEGLRQHVDELTKHVQELTKHVHEMHDHMGRMERAMLELSDRTTPRTP